MEHYGILVLLFGPLFGLALVAYVYVRCRRARWRRRLQNILRDAGASHPASPSSAPVALEETPEWRRILGVWSAIADPRRVRFDQTCKKLALGALATAIRDVESLTAAGRLREAEAGMLRHYLDGLQKDEEAKLTSDEQAAYMRSAAGTCYRPASVEFIRTVSTLERLADRMQLWKRLLAEERVDPAVARKVLVLIEADLETIQKADVHVALPAEKRAEAEEGQKVAQQALDHLKAKLAATAPASVPSASAKEHP